MDLGATKQRAILAMLALHGNTPVSVDRLIEGLWGERPPVSAPKMVQLYVSRLRKLLDGDDAEIVTRSRGYELRIPPECIDAVRFEHLVNAAAGNVPSPNGTAFEALSLWRGSPLDDLADEPFAASEIRRLEELWLQARELAIDDALARGEHATILGEIEELVAEHPFRERLHAQRMLALYRSGRQVEALEIYRLARNTLVEEVGVEPGPDLRRLHEAILRQDPTLELDPEQRPARAPEPKTDTDRRKRTLGVIALLAALGAIAAVVVSQLGGAESLERIDADAVGLIDPGDGSITAQYTIGDSPGALVAGGGSVWVASPGAGTVSRIDPGSEQVTTIDVGGEPTALAYGAGSLWVADAQTHRLAQVDPRTNRVSRRFDVGNAPRSVVVDSGAVWVASPVDGRIDRIDLGPAGGVRQIDVGGRPVALTAGAGAVWAVAEEARVVARIEPRSGAVVGTTQVGNGPAGVAAGAGAVWVTNREDGTVSRIDPATASVTATVPVGGSPEGIAVGGGAVWVADAARGTVIRIDGRTSQVSRRLDVRSSPVALVFAQGSLWTSALASRASHRGGTLRYLTGPFDFCRCIDPAGYDARTWPLLSLVYDGLLAYRRVGGGGGSALVADLATSVPEPADGGRTYVFQLRRGLRFSNGTPVRPKDFRATMERVLRLASAPEIYNIVGAERCTPRQCDLSKGIELDAQARTITVRLSSPDGDFLHRLALPLAYVVPADSPVMLARRRALPGTGPYRFAGFDAARGGGLVRNRRFRSWSAEARPGGFPDRVAVTIGTDPAAQVASVRSGRDDVVLLTGGAGVDLPAADLRALAVAEVSRVQSVPAAETYYLFLNTREAPFDDVRVRRALNYAVDRRRVVEIVGGVEVAGPTCGIIPPGFPGYRPSCPYARRLGVAGAAEPDLARALRLVARSGTSGTRVEVAGSDGPFEGVARYTGRVLRELGYRSRTRIIGDIGRYFQYVGDSPNRVQVGVAGWLADFLTPSNFFSSSFTCQQLVPGSPVNNNLAQFCDPAVDDLHQRAVAARGAEAGALWAAVERRVAQAAPAAPLYNGRSVVLVSDRVGNVQQHLQLGPLLDQLWVR